jgi:formylglycine-generating enzyme required for sulfatase activity
MMRPLLLALLLLPGCLQPTEIVVSILTQRAPSSIAELRVDVRTRKEAGAVSAIAPITAQQPRFPATLGLLGAGGRTIEIDVNVTGVGAKLQRSAVVSFVNGKVMLLRMPLDCPCGPCPPLEQKDLEPYDEALARQGPEAGANLDCGPGKDGDLGRDGPRPERPTTDAPFDLRRDGKPDGKPDAPAPDAKKKDGPQPDTKKDGPKPDIKKPDGPNPDTKKVDQPKLDLAKPDLPKPDLPKPDTKKVDLPKPDQQAKPDMVIPTLPSCTNGYCFIPAGSFMMGSPSTDPCRSPDEVYHQVNLTRHFEMGQTEFTVAQLNALKPIPDPNLYDVSGNKTCGATCPVEQVTWNQAAHLCNQVSIQRAYNTCYQCSGVWPTIFPCTFKYADYYSCPGYRLPTEAEWEYAVRAGTTTVTYAGDPVTSACTSTASALALVGNIAWYPANAAGAKHPAGQKGSNPWGLQDMFGNVLEWTGDDYVVDLSTYPSTDPWIYNTYLSMSVRGPSFKGSWQWSDIRAGNRSGRTDPDVELGFRCVRSLTGTSP